SRLNFHIARMLCSVWKSVCKRDVNRNEEQAVAKILQFFERERIVAGPNFNRWLVPPAALAIHLAIGQAYAFSVFNLPMTRQIGITQSTAEDWSIPTLGWIFSIAIVFLGVSAAFLGRWLERAGPRKAMALSALCFSAGFLVAALGVSLHQIVLVYLG